MVHFPIDVVFTWGSQPPEPSKLTNIPSGECLDESLHPKRYRDLGLLPFAVRSVQENAPWVRKIVVVTNGEAPSKLPQDIPVEVVSHTDIFQYQDHLPTYNSSAIEASLGFIPDLAEHFLYFNDDMFLGAPVKPDLFYDKGGTIHLFFESRYLPVRWFKIGFEKKIHTAKKINSLNLMLETFGKKRVASLAPKWGRYPRRLHQVQVCRKSLWKEAWSHPQLQPALLETSHTPIKHRSNIEIFYLLALLALVNGKGVVCPSPREQLFYLTDSIIDMKMNFDVILEDPPTFFCLNLKQAQSPCTSHSTK